MPYNGSGVYNLPVTTVSPAVGNTTIDSSAMNTLTADIKAALSTALTKDGQTTVTANLPMAGFKHTGVAVAAALTDYSSADDVIDNTLLYAGASAAGTDTYAATLPISPGAYKTGQTYYFVADVVNTGPCTINFNSIGAKSIKLMDGSDPINNDIQPGPIFVFYDGTNFVLLNQETLIQTTQATNRSHYAYFRDDLHTKNELDPAVLGFRTETLVDSIYNDAVGLLSQVISTGAITGGTTQHLMGFNNNGDKVEIEVAFYVPTLSTASEDFILRVGLCSGSTLHDVSAVNPASAAWIQYNHAANSGNWVTKTSDSTGTPVVESQNTSVAVVAGQRTVLKIIYDVVAGDIEFIIDGSTTNTHSTTLPASLRTFRAAFGCLHQATAGANVTNYIDYMTGYQYFPSGR